VSMEFKGTKGKWEVSVNQFENNNIICDGFYLGEARNKYDALLISKAPEMLEMLKKIILEIDPHSQSKQYGEIEQLIEEATELK
jgi:hypothetical protein